jgi:uncharacterized peroxidase-related enzyme
METLNNRTFTVPERKDVSEANKTIFDTLQKGIGFVPNLYAYFAKNETALGDYLTFQNRKSTLSSKEREVVNLVTSQINGCRYCQSAHTALARMLRFTDEQILEIRQGSASFDPKLDALANFTASVVKGKGRIAKSISENLFAAGYTEANMIDILIVIGDKIISNYLHNLTQLPIDFPLADDIA